MEAINFLGLPWTHDDGRHYTSARCSRMDQGNVAVDVRKGRVVSVVCLACGNNDFTLLVEGRNEFWPVASAQVIHAEAEGGETDDQ